MRWRMVDPSDKREQAEREATIAQIDLWWERFQTECDAISASFSRQSTSRFAKKGALTNWMRDHLQAISPSLMWEYGPALNGNGNRLVITPESDRQLRPLLSAILERAPSLPGWEFYPYRVPEDVAIARQTVRVRAGVDSADFRVRLARGDHNRIDLCYASPSVKSLDDQTAFNAAFVATESLLGEELLDKWV